MSHSFDSADRPTHVKVVVLGAVLGLAIAGVAVSVRSDDHVRVSVIKATRTVAVTERESAIR